MAIKSPVQLKVSIWRDFSPRRHLVVFPRGEEDLAMDGDLDLNFQEEVYSWCLREYPFAGIEDERVQRHLDEQLRALHPDQPPSKRRLATLEAFVAAAEDAIASGKAGLAPIESLPLEDGDDPQKFNVLLAFAQHLKWLSRCYASRPGTSASIR